MKLESTLDTVQETAPAQRRAAETRTSWFTPQVRRIIRLTLIQLFLFIMLVIVVFPVLWIVSMAIDPRGIARPTDLNLFPANATLDAFTSLLRDPFSNVLPIYFGDMLMNSLFVALGTSLASVVVGTSAAYAFSRFKFIGREGGMLVFIILLILPGTGTLIPLFVMFSAIDVHTTLAAFPPAFFAGVAVATGVIVPYRIARSLLKPPVDSKFQIDRRLVTMGILIAAFLAIWLTFYVLFDRNPLYNHVVAQPLSLVEEPLAVAQDDYDQKVEGVANFERTLGRAQRTADTSAGVAAELHSLRDQITSADTLLTFIPDEIASRQGSEDSVDIGVVEVLTAVQTMLDEEGADSALAAFDAQIETADTDAADDAQTLEERQASLVERQDSVAAAEQILSEAQSAYDTASAEIFRIRDGVISGVLRYVALAWLGAVVGAAIVWGVVYLLRQQIEPQVLVGLLAWGLALLLLVLFAWENFQWRVDHVASDTQTLRQTLFGLALAFASSTLPFTIWNLKGFFDTIPKALEEAALIDGSGVFSTFFRIMLPLSLPAFAVTILVSFMTGWSEFILSWVFMIGRTENYTLAMGLATMVNGANRPPPDMQKFAAMSILFSLPILVLFFSFQRFLVSGLTVGAVK